MATNYYVPISTIGASDWFTETFSNTNIYNSINAGIIGGTPNDSTYIGKPDEAFSEELVAFGIGADVPLPTSIVVRVRCNQPSGAPVWDLDFVEIRDAGGALIASNTTNQTVSGTTITTKSFTLTLDPSYASRNYTSVSVYVGAYNVSGLPFIRIHEIEVEWNYAGAPTGYQQQYVYPPSDGGYLSGVSDNTQQDIIFFNQSGSGVRPVYDIDGSNITPSYTSSLMDIDEGVGTPNDADYLYPKIDPYFTTPNGYAFTFKYGETYVGSSGLFARLRVETSGSKVYSFSAKAFNNDSNELIGFSDTYYTSGAGKVDLTFPMYVVNPTYGIVNPKVEYKVARVSGSYAGSNITNRGNTFTILATDLLFSGSPVAISSVPLSLLGGLQICSPEILNYVDGDKSTYNPVSIIGPQFTYYQKFENGNDFEQIGSNVGCMTTSITPSSLFDRGLFLVTEGSGTIIRSVHTTHSGIVVPTGQDCWRFNGQQLRGTQRSTNYFNNKGKSLNGTTITIGHTDYFDAGPGSRIGVNPQSVIVPNFPSGDFSLFVNADYLGRIYTPDIEITHNVVSTTPNGVQLSFYDSANVLQQTNFSLQNFVGKTYVENKGFLLTYASSVYKYYCVDSDKLTLCYTSPTINRRSTSGSLTFEALSDTVNYGNAQPFGLGRFGIATSGFSNTDVNTVQNWITDVMNQVPRTTSGTYTSTDFSAVYRMPRNISGNTGHLYGMIGDLAYLSGDMNLYSIPSQSRVTMNAWVQYTGNNPSGFFVYPRVYRNNNEYFNVWGSGNALRIFPSSGVHKISFTDSWSDPTPTPMHPSQFEFRAVSRNCISGYNGGDFNVYAMDFTIDNAFCIPPTPSYGNLTLFLSGSPSVRNNIPLYLHAQSLNSGVNLYLKAVEPSGINNGIPLYINNTPTIYSGINLYISGGQVVGNVPLYIRSDAKPSETESIPLFIYSTASSGLYNGTTLYLESTGKSTSVPLFIANDQGNSNNASIPLHLEGTPQPNGAINLYLSNNSSGINNQIGLFISGGGLFEGYNPYNGGCTLYLEMKEGVERSVPLYLNVASGQTSNVNMYIAGGTYSQGNVPLYISGSENMSSDVNLFIHGF